MPQRLNLQEIEQGTQRCVPCSFMRCSFAVTTKKARMQVDSRHHIRENQS
jgi:hypothetical protein